MKGVVVKLKDKRTAVVKVERVFRHPRYLKTSLRHKKFLCVVPKGLPVSEGKRVEVRETSPQSKTKHWKVERTYD